jgi:hypothetical protein
MVDTNELIWGYKWLSTYKWSAEFLEVSVIFCTGFFKRKPQLLPQYFTYEGYKELTENYGGVQYMQNAKSLQSLLEHARHILAWRATNVYGDLVKILAVKNWVHFFFHNNFSLIITDSKGEFKKSLKWSCIYLCLASHHYLLYFVRWVQWCQVWRISAKQLFNTVNGELVSCSGRKNRASQLNLSHSDVYCSTGIFSRGWQPWRSQDHTLGRVRKIWALWLILKGTQDWDIFGFHFWNLYYFLISYVKI